MTHSNSTAHRKWIINEYFSHWVRKNQLKYLIFESSVQCFYPKKWFKKETKKKTVISFNFSHFLSVKWYPTRDNEMKRSQWMINNFNFIKWINFNCEMPKTLIIMCNNVLINVNSIIYAWIGWFYWIDDA